MNSYRLLVSLTCLLLLFGIGTLAQDDDSPFTIDFNGDPVIERGDWNEWDGRFTSVGTVFYHDGQFHLFRNGYPNWPRPSGIAYHISDDGITWTEVGDLPVIAPEVVEEAGFDVDTALVYSGLVTEDGTWMLYFQAFVPDWGDVPGGVILATADDPTGEWTIHDEMVIIPDADSWENGAIGAPSVVVVDGEYRMYYHGRDGGGIGVATSPDGFVWTKHDDPTTTEPPYALSDPIFLPAEDEDAWDAESIYDPTVAITPDGFVMAYSANPGVSGHGLAISEDGMNFERLQQEPLFQQTDLDIIRDFWLVRMAYHDERYFFFAEINNRSGTDIYMDTLDGLLTE